MEETQVIIVGGGPAGLALGLSLARLKIRSVILEKEPEITTDPRGVFLTGDAIRILHSLGINDLAGIGHEIPHVNVHRSAFNAPPFFSVPVGDINSLEQALPEGILQMQPRLEMALRKAIDQSQYCSFRPSCEVVSRSEQDPPVIDFKNSQGTRQQIKGEWLIGADGKLGIVRKHFLEPTVGIKQQDGLYPYSGTWIAANLKMKLPTPESHPDFPLWKLGYSPQEVYDLFWPIGWHFCTPPGKATASGRFGPYEERLWRHEFAQDESLIKDNSEELLWEHITPMITLEQDKNRNHRFSGPVQYPRDCIEILRCRPFHFVHKVVNCWFSGRTILIGDAAHVFPPFAGQGIGSGVRDAHQLAWRLALMLHPDSKPENHDKLLKCWESERRQSINDAAQFSMINGRICNNEPSLWQRLFFRLLMLLHGTSAFRYVDYMHYKEKKGFSNVENGFFIKGCTGGSRLPQIHMRSKCQAESFLSDGLLRKDNTIFTLVVMGDGNPANQLRLHAEATAAVQEAGLSSIISKDAIVFYDAHWSGSSQGQKTLSDTNGGLGHPMVCSPSQIAAADGHMANGYDSSVFAKRLGRGTKFAIIRPDFFIFACASDYSGLVGSLRSLRSHVGFGDKK
ncbi:3-(3-hydroxy-phenyl)propionate 3-hydroxycinnamic acid hydroxylase [Fusarium tjaetaba]|uniref:3-(3-hydroxy-phenyl)propionate 3-hydroxycinnamic acid hydroxylase n=1 Tax=Fusarium tjaetaba TaxID=1567544 RepID=A0A8H5W2Q6_9HYPO|nr:3-(3-hydroxy-phenyl)propionate 3-hydroxycinnamic acid hydroxylase [Fusarium tjaetaba]KAF5643370.1 3-(3-hydroxy-phenyl)propionate 3-hydroxycinnamic acid hydroxylase [Fusarium tjaetaba]